MKTDARDGGDLRAASFRGLGFLLVVLAVLTFGPAWSLAYWQGWLYLATFGGATLGITLYFLQHDPDLIGRRLAAGASAEALPAQKVIQAVASLCFIAIFVVSALDYRFGWSGMGALPSIVADGVVLAGFAGVFLTFRENSFTAATITVDEAQPVIATGPYAIVRHPMYASAGLLVLATPPALGSLWGLAPALLLMAAIVARLLDEERFLVRNLPGYAGYLERTHYRLLPWIW